VQTGSKISVPIKLAKNQGLRIALLIACIARKYASSDNRPRPILTEQEYE
jgi:hypothetical protein